MAKNTNNKKRRKYENDDIEKSNLNKKYLTKTRKFPIKIV